MKSILNGVIPPKLVRLYVNVKMNPITIGITVDKKNLGSRVTIIKSFRMYAQTGEFTLIFIELFILSISKQNFLFSDLNFENVLFLIYFTDLR